MKITKILSICALTTLSFSIHASQNSSLVTQNSNQPLGKMILEREKLFNLQQDVQESEKIRSMILSERKKVRDKSPLKNSYLSSSPDCPTEECSPKAETSLGILESSSSDLLPKKKIVYPSLPLKGGAYEGTFTQWKTHHGCPLETDGLAFLELLSQNLVGSSLLIEDEKAPNLLELNISALHQILDQVNDNLNLSHDPKDSIGGLLLNVVRFLNEVDLERSLKRKTQDLKDHSSPSSWGLWVESLPKAHSREEDYRSVLGFLGCKAGTATLTLSALDQRIGNLTGNLWTDLVIVGDVLGSLWKRWGESSASSSMACAEGLLGLSEGEAFKKTQRWAYHQSFKILGCPHDRSFYDFLHILSMTVIKPEEIIAKGRSEDGVYRPEPFYGLYNSVKYQPYNFYQLLETKIGALYSQFSSLYPLLKLPKISNEKVSPSLYEMTTTLALSLDCKEALDLLNSKKPFPESELFFLKSKILEEEKENLLGFAFLRQKETEQEFLERLIKLEKRIGGSGENITQNLLSIQKAVDSIYRKIKSSQHLYFYNPTNISQNLSSIYAFLGKSHK